MAELAVENIDGGVVFMAKIVPASSKTALAGLLADMLKVKVASPPEKGKANKCLTEFLAERLGVQRKDIRIISGQSSPVKQVKILGITGETLLKKLDLDKRN